jgi:hypothetical protein
MFHKVTSEILQIVDLNEENKKKPKIFPISLNKDVHITDSQKILEK